MEKSIIFFLLLSFVLIIKCDDKLFEKEEEEEYSDLNRNNYFKEALKEYLIEHNLYNNDKLIQPNDIKTIFLNVFTGQSKDSLPEEIVETFDKLSNYFINIYFKDRKEIRGKEFYDLVDINEIFIKMEELFPDNSDDDKDSSGL